MLARLAGSKERKEKAMRSERERIRPVVLSGAAMGALASAVFGAPAAAQDAPSGVEEVIVTAEKRQTKLQKTPSAISALSAAKLESQNISGAEELQYNVPSLVAAQQSGYSFLTIRGIGTDLSTTAAEPSVASYEDNVYTGSLITQTTPDFDLERIEVLRGPQGTLYGRNATGGVINYITKAPSFDPELNLALTAGSFRHSEINAGLTGPIIADKLAYRVSFQVAQRDGYRDNINLGVKEDDLDAWGGRAALLFQPTENLSVTLRGDYMSHDSSNPYVAISSASVPVFGPLDLLMSPAAPLGVFSMPASYFDANPGLLSPADIARLGGGSIADYLGFQSQPGPLPPNPERTRDISTSIPARYDVRTGGSSLTFDWDIGAINFKSISAFRYGRLIFEQDSTGFATPNVVFYPAKQDFNQWTQEFNVSGAAFEDRLEWLVGAFYFHEKSRFANTVYLPLFGEYLTANLSLANQDPTSPFAFDLSQPLLSLFQSPDILGTTVISGPGFGGASPVEADNLATIPATPFTGARSIQTSQSIAGFAQATYHLSDRLRVTGGLRYTMDQKDVARSFHSNLLVALGASSLLCQGAEEQKRWYALTGTVGVDYDLAERTMVYGKYSHGYKAGGFNPFECSGGFDPEHLDSYEIGLKTIFGEGQFSVSAAGFYYDYKNIQFTTFVQNASAMKNAGAAELYGLELEFQAVPVAIPGLSIDGSASWVHSEYTAGNPFDPDGMFLDPAQLARLDIRGNELIRSPRFKLALGVQYEIDMASSGRLTLRGEAAWTDKFYNDIFEGEAPYQAATVQPAYWLLNARVTWELNDGKYQVQAFGENLTDELYANNRVSFNTPQTFVNVAGQFAAPRRFGLRVSMKFDGF